MATDEKMIELQEMDATIKLPEQAVEVNIEAKVYIDGEIKTVTRHLGLTELREAFDDAKVWVVNEDKLDELDKTLFAPLHIEV